MARVVVWALAVIPTELAPGSPYRHVRVMVPAPPPRTRRAFMVAGAIVSAGLVLSARLVPATVEHPVDTRATPAALHVAHFDDAEVEALTGVVAFAVSQSTLVAMQSDGRAFALDPGSSSGGRRVATPDERPIDPTPWMNGPAEVVGVVWSCDYEPHEAYAACLRATDGTARCEPGQPTPPREVPSPPLCRRLAGGTVMCRSGLSDGRVEDTPRPHPIASAARFTTLRACEHHSCGVTTDRTVACWGPAVRVVDGPDHVTAITMRAGESCALTAEGDVWCWDPDELTHVGRRKELAPASALAADGTATCALTRDGAVWCWGAIGHAWPGHPRALRATRALDVRLPVAAVTIFAASHDVLCAYLRDGTTRCWGGTADAWSTQRPTERLGDTAADETWVAHDAVPDAFASEPVPRGEYAVRPERPSLLDDGRVVVSDPTRVRGVSVLGDLPLAREVVSAESSGYGGAHHCALARDGRAWCWGSNLAGRLGLDDAVGEDEWRVVQVRRAARAIGPGPR